MELKKILVLLSLVASCWFETNASLGPIANASLDRVCGGYVEPEKDSIYYCGLWRLNILQVLPGGALVNLGSNAPHDHEHRIVFVKMDTSDIVDGGMLRGGIYQCTGSFQYVSSGGAPRTVASFRKLNKEEIDEVERNKTDQKERAAKEDEERARREQPKRKLAAKEILSRYDFNVESRCRVSRGLALKDVSVSVRHFAWKKMRELMQKEDWLELLNALADVLDGESDFTHRYKQYPEEREMAQIADRLLDERSPLRVSVRVNPKTDFVVLRRNERWAHISTDRTEKVCCVGAPFESVIDETLNPFCNQYYIVLREEAPVLRGEPIRDVEESLNTVKGLFDVESYQCLSQIVQVRKRCGSLYGEYQAKEISASDYLVSLKKVIDDFALDNVLEKLFVPLGDEGKTKRLKDDVVSENAEKFGAEMLSLHLGMRDRLIVQSDLRKYIHGVRVSDLLWNELHKLQEAKDWKGMFSAVAKYDNSVNEVDFSNKEQLGNLLKVLMAQEFRMDIEFTRKLDVRARSILREGNSDHLTRMDKFCRSSGGNIGKITHKFKIGETVLIYSRDYFDDVVKELYENSTEALRGVDKMVSDRRISASEADKRREDLISQYSQALSKWLATKKVRIDDAEPAECKGEREVSLLPDAASATSPTVQKDCEMFRSCWDGITPNSKAKTKLQKQSSVLIQAMKHEKMTAIYKRYCKDDPKTMLGNFGKEWKSQSGRRDEIYAKYFDLYVGRLHRAAIESGCEGLPSLIHNEQEDAGGSAPNKCNECGGKCYVKKMAECPKCSGTGKIVHPPKQMITGMSAERVGVCPSCRGKGQVMQKVKCPACQN